MNQEPTYHIDVTPEEDALFKDSARNKIAEKFVPNTFKKVFCLVLGAHLLIGAAIVMSTNTAKAGSNKSPVNSTEPIAEVPVQKATPIATPEPIVQATPTPKPQVAATKPTEAENKPTIKPPTVQRPNDKFVREYTIKQGDTITTIAKKYKLSTERLIKINNIKDVNKIQVGQKLKFM
jgi:LysM repeat protein